MAECFTEVGSIVGNWEFMDYLLMWERIDNMEIRPFVWSNTHINTLGRSPELDTILNLLPAF